MHSSINALKMKLHFHKADAVTEMCVQVRTESGRFEEVFSGTTKSFHLAKLWPSSVYEFRTCGTNAAGTGPFGPPAFLATKGLALTTPTLQAVLSGAEGSVDVAWRGNNQLEDAGADYELQLQCDDDKNDRSDTELSGRQICIKTDTLTVTKDVGHAFTSVHVGPDTHVTVSCAGHGNNDSPSNTACALVARVRMVCPNQEPGSFSEPLAFSIHHP